MNIITDIAIALSILGTTYCDMGEFSQSQDLLEESLAINRKVYTVNHPNTAISLTKLGNVYRYVLVCINMSGTCN